MRPNIDPPESVSDAHIVNPDPGDTHEGGGFQTQAEVADDGGDDVDESGEDE